jgi:hypothetical protein
MGGPNTIEAEVVLISFGKPFDMAEVAQPSRAKGSIALARVGHDPF